MIANAVLVANVYSGPLPPTTQDWISESFPIGKAILFKKETSIVCAKNSMIRDGALPAIRQMRKFGVHVDWAWFIDNDVTITHPGLDKWLATEGDVVSCDCEMRNHRAFSSEEAFHNHFWRCRVEVLEKLEAPWFEPMSSADGCDMLGCECQTFAAKARAAGFTVRHGGWCSHGNQGSWLKRGTDSGKITADV